jgi:glycosyltransferase involved in cell wall biosynthesis
LELQMAHTRAALERRNHTVVRVEAVDRGVDFDLLHAFHSEEQLWTIRPHWKLNRCPLVLSPVMTLTRGERRWLRLLRQVPGVATSAKIRASLLQDAAAIVALTSEEREVLVRRLGAPAERVAVIGNGVPPFDLRGLPSRPEEVPDGPYALMVGNVSSRKRQREVLERGAAPGIPYIIVGDLEGGSADRASFATAVRQAGGVWLGGISDPRVVRRLQAEATALVLFSVAEGQSLAVLETLAAGSPVIVSDLPAHRHLRDRFGPYVRIVRRVSDISDELTGLSESPPTEPAPAVPTWDDIAEQLETVYKRALSGDPRRPVS